MLLSEAKQILKKNGYRLSEDIHGPAVELSTKQKAKEILEFIKAKQINADTIIDLLLNDGMYRVSQYGLREILFENKWLLEYFNNGEMEDDEPISDSDVPSLSQCRRIFKELVANEWECDKIVELLVDMAIDDNEEAIEYIWDEYVNI